MLNHERFEMEIKGVTLSPSEGNIYLEEAGIDPNGEYTATSTVNKKAILVATLAALESIANDPANMKNYKADDMTIMDFSVNIENRITALSKKIRMMKDSDTEATNSSTFMLFTR